jgi:hypothetical protein
MASIISRNAAAELLRPGLRQVVAEYAQRDKVWPKIFDKGTSIQAVERTVDARLVGLPSLKAEGAPMTADQGSGTRFTWLQEHIEPAIYYTLTRRMVEDNLYQQSFKTSNLGLQRSFSQFEDIMGAAIFNNAQTYDSSIGGDGKALCATDHPIDGGTFANTFSTQVELGEGTLLEAQVFIGSTFRDYSGILIAAKAKKLLIPPALEPIAVRLLKTTGRPGTADNDVNAISYINGGIPEGYVVNPFLTSSKSWFVLTDIEGLLYLDRRPFEMEMWVDDVTQNISVGATQRYSFGFFNPRAVWGSFPT